MARGSSSTTLISLGIVGAGVFLVWDYFFNGPCKHLFPLFNMWDIGCGTRAGLIMDPTRIGNVLRGANQSAGGKFNQSVDEMLKDAIKRGNQGVKQFTVPSQPGRVTGGSQAVRPGTGIYTGKSGAPNITSKFLKPGRPMAPPAIDPFKPIMQQLQDLFQLKGTPRNLAEYQRWLSQGFKDPGGRILESLRGGKGGVRIR